MARPSHWVKNAFILPGFFAAQMLVPDWTLKSAVNLVVAIGATCLVASANYVLNEWLDAKSDAHHPLKKHRPAVIGSISLKNTLVFYSILALSGLLISGLISSVLFFIELSLLVMGWIYNVPPIRMKDKPYLDVLSESINNPIRLSIGWVCVNSTSAPPLSLLVGYWFGGAFLMNVKRFAERRTLLDKDTAILYRRSFAHYTEEKLLAASLFYAMISFFFVGIFAIKYRLEYILIIPSLAHLYVKYFNLGMKENSVAQRPENLYKQVDLLGLLVVLVLQYLILTFTDITVLADLFD
jgi:4-hydroxybenzoate polyprenyltransferase